MKKNELKTTRDKYAAYQEEMNDTEIRIESLALDLEMAEEKVPILVLIRSAYIESSLCF